MKSKDWRPTAFVETQPGVVSEEEADAGRVEQRRALFDFLRHLMTLDSAALALTVSLIDKAFAHPVQRAAVGVAIAAFLVSLVGGGVSYLALLGHPVRAGAIRISTSDRRIYLVSILLVFVGFLLGLGGLAWFFWVNWLGR